MSARLASVIEATADSASDDEHDPEGTTLAVERGQLVAQLERSRVRLEEIDAALERLGRGADGRCETCGEEIGRNASRSCPPHGNAVQTCGEELVASMVRRTARQDSPIPHANRQIMPSSAERSSVGPVRE